MPFLVTNVLVMWFFVINVQRTEDVLAIVCVIRFVVKHTLHNGVVLIKHQIAICIIATPMVVQVLVVVILCVVFIMVNI